MRILVSVSKPRYMRIILLTLFSFSSLTLFSQQDSLLKKFKYRVDRYQAVSFNIGGSGQYGKTNFVSGPSEGNSSGGNFGVNYLFLKSTDRILLNISTGLSSSFGFANNKDQSITNKYRSFDGNSYLSIQNKWFGKKIFTELEGTLSGYLNNNKYIVKTSPQGNEQKNNQYQYSVAITAGIGKGRLENVTDMQNALWLYKSLQDENKLSRSLSADELNELGRTITKANNTRLLDTRKRTQYMLETTDSFFQSKGVVVANDIRYFSTLNDILFFAFNNQRLSGTEIFFRLTPSINKGSKDESNKIFSTNNETRNLIKVILLSAGFTKHIPVNLKHQNNYGVALEANYTNWDMSDKYFVSGNPTTITDMNSTLKQAGINAFFQHAIYPNTRTNIIFDLSGETGYEDINGDDGFFGEATLSGALNYFISYRTRLTGGLGVSYRKNTFLTTYDITQLPEMFYLNANIGLQVSL